VPVLRLFQSVEKARVFGNNERSARLNLRELVKGRLIVGAWWSTGDAIAGLSGSTRVQGKLLVNWLKVFLRE
jgi:hypothetical protein